MIEKVTNWRGPSGCHKFFFLFRLFRPLGFNEDCVEEKKLINQNLSSRWDPTNLVAPKISQPSWRMNKGEEVLGATQLGPSFGSKTAF